MAEVESEIRSESDEEVVSGSEPRLSWDPSVTAVPLGRGWDARPCILDWFGSGRADLLVSAGFRIERANARFEGGEPVADLRVLPATDPRPVNVDGDPAARMIDELPVLAVSASQAEGTSVIAGAAELRVKESDRLYAMKEGLRAMGADITASEDGWVINGPRDLEGARVSSWGDHRVAMALAVAALLADGKTEIEGAECVDISYPDFFDHLDELA